MIPAQQSVFFISALLLSIAGQSLGREQQDHAQALVGYALTVSTEFWVCFRVPLA